MKTLIVYESRFGTVKKAVDYIALKLKASPDIMKTKEAGRSSMDEYENIIIGGSVMMGKIQKKIRSFIDKKIDSLLDKNIILFIAAAAQTKQEIDKETKDAFPGQLRDKAAYISHIGYSFDFDKMNFFYSSIIKKSMNVENSVMKIDYEELEKIAGIINR